MILRWALPLAALAALAGWLLISPEGALGKLDAVGYAVCHRIDARSFHVAGRQLPMCARCSGEFSAAAIALSFQAWRGGRAARFPSRPIIFVLLAFLAAFAVDGLNSFMFLIAQTGASAPAVANLYTPSNTLRLLTGSGMGIALAALLFPAVNQTIWRDLPNRTALDAASFRALLLIVGAWDALILTEAPAVLYAAGVASALGVLALLVSVFAMFWITLLRQENGFVLLRELWLPACAGLTLALLLVVGIDVVRFQMTGTWGGFPGLTGA